MGKKEFTSTLTNATDADFRAWVGAWIQGWKDAGLAQLPDAGQINLVTAVRPTSAALYPGYALFHLDDSLHGEAPVYIKAEFGGMSSTGNAPSVVLTVGKGVSGGALTGILLPRTEVHMNGGSGNNGISASLLTHIASTGEGWFAFLANTNALYSFFNQSIIIERSRTPAGLPSADGLMVTLGKGGTVGQLTSVTDLPAVRAINYASGAYCEGVPPVVVPYSVNGTALGPSTSLAAGSIGPVFPWVLIAPGLAPWQSCAIVSIPSGDYPGGIFTTRLCGVESKFRAIPASATHRWGMAITASSAAQSSTHVGPAIRWED